MNRLAFNPNKDIIQEWKDVYINIHQISTFQSLIDKLYLYLDVVLTDKIKYIQKQRKKNQLIFEQKKVILEGITIPSNLCINEQDDFFQIHKMKDISQQIKQTFEGRKAFQAQYGLIFRQSKKLKDKQISKEDLVLNFYAKHKNPQNYKYLSTAKINFIEMFEVFQSYFSNLEKDVLRTYMKYLSQNDELIQKFVYYKIQTIRNKSTKFVDLKSNILRHEQKSDISELPEQTYCNIRTLFQNLFIQVHYLDKLVSYNLHIFKSFQEEADNKIILLQAIRTRHKQRMSVLHEMVEQVKREVRNLYSLLYETTRAQRNDPHRLWNCISDQIAVNKTQFQQVSTKLSFTNGFSFATLLFSLVGILVFRGLSLQALEQNSSYMTEFKIWRGASYLIFTNWIIGIVFYILDQCKVNYRLILLQVDTFVPKAQSFLQTATILSSIYLILFLTYLLKAVDIIQGYDLMLHLGYFMWLINILFMINPFKIMNYQGRRFFIKLIGKVIISPFRPMNNNIFFVALIMGSFVQPFSDFSFTVCSLAYDMRRDCIRQARIATFIYTEIYLLIRVVQCMRSHSQLKVKKLFSRPRLGLIAVVFSINTVISSFLYNTYLGQGLLIYWIVSAVFATIAGINTNVKGNWGLISFDSEDCILRKTKTFPRKVYFIGIIAQIFLSIGWVFTISNNLSFSNSISPMYFLMILSYTELVRRGIWIIFKLEDDHSINVNNLNAVVSDESIYKQLQQRYTFEARDKMDCIREMANAISSNELLVHSINEKMANKKKTSTLQQVQADIYQHKLEKGKIEELQKQFFDYLSLMQCMYLKLNWKKYI